MAARVIILAVVVYGLSLLGAILAGSSPGAPALLPDPPQDFPTADTPESPDADRPALPQLVGMSLSFWHTQPIDPYLDAVDRIAEMGFNTVQVATPIFQINGASEQVQRNIGPGGGPSNEDLLTLLHHIKSRGLVAVLMPQINFTAPRGNEWRGKIQPERWQPWWDSYQAVIDEYLDMATQAQADVLCIGCELVSTQTPDHADRWRRLIRHARQRFRGALAYSATWDTFHNVGFWSELDVIGVSAYWDLTQDADDPDAPTAAELRDAWVKIRQDRLLPYAQSQNRPLLLTEVGYLSLPWTLRDPWNYVTQDDTPADHQIQARAYRAFLEAWRGWLLPPQAAASIDQVVLQTVSTPAVRWELPDPRIAGALFYLWDPYQFGGPRDTGYGIRGKPAYNLVQQWLQGE